MSVETINWAFKQDIKQSGYKLVLIALSDYANDEFIAYPSWSTLEKKCSCSRMTISRATKHLVEHGYIDKVDLDEYVGKKYNNKQNCYRINITETSNKMVPVTKRYGYQNVTSTSNKMNTETSNKMVPKPLICNKPSINHHKKTNKKENQVDYTFADFWNIYPKKLDIAKAEQAFDKAVSNHSFPKTKEQLHNCLIPLYVLHQVGKSQFIPYGSSWLNGKRWQDRYDQESFINEQIAHINDFAIKDTKRKSITNFIQEQVR